MLLLLLLLLSVSDVGGERYGFFANDDLRDCKR